jgi:hypothetical protein
MLADADAVLTECSLWGRMLHRLLNQCVLYKIAHHQNSSTVDTVQTGRRASFQEAALFLVFESYHNVHRRSKGCFLEKSGCSSVSTFAPLFPGSTFSVILYSDRTSLPAYQSAHAADK